MGVSEDERSYQCRPSTRVYRIQGTLNEGGLGLELKAVNELNGCFTRSLNTALLPFFVLGSPQLKPNKK